MLFPKMHTYPTWLFFDQSQISNYKKQQLCALVMCVKIFRSLYDFWDALEKLPNADTKFLKILTKLIIVFCNHFQQFLAASPSPDAHSIEETKKSVISKLKDLDSVALWFYKSLWFLSET